MGNKVNKISKGRGKRYLKKLRIERLQRRWAQIKRNNALGITHFPDNSVADLHSPAPVTATTSSAAEGLPAGEQVVEEPLTTELAVEGPDAAQPLAPAPAAPPPSRLRPRCSPSAPVPRKHDKNLRRAVAVGDKERLAQLVCAHPVLYNQDYVRPGDSSQTRYAWFDISRKMQRPESECISMWKRLKERYRAALTRRKRALEQGLKVKPSIYENYMSFMKPFMYIWTKVAAADEAGSGDDAAPSAPEYRRTLVALGPAVARQPCYPQNTLVELFRNLGETVKAFPKDVRSRVKSEVLKVVSDARDLVLSNNSVEQLYIVEDVKEESMDENEQS